MQNVKREPDDDGDGDVNMDVDGGYDDRDNTAGSAAVPVVIRTPKKSASQATKVGGVFGAVNGDVEEGGGEGDVSREEEEVEVEEQLAEVPKRDDRSAVSYCCDGDKVQPVAALLLKLTCLVPAHLG